MLVLTVKMDFRDLWVLQVLKAKLDFLDYLANKASWEPQVFKVLQENLARKVTVVFPDLLDDKDQLDQQDQLDHQETKDPEDNQDLWEKVDQLDPEENLVNLDPRE